MCQKNWITGLLLLSLGMLGGCGQSYWAGQLLQTRNAYQSKQYSQVYRLATQLTRSPDQVMADEGNYLAGMAALKLHQPQTAHNLLLRATRSRDRQLAGDALAELGLIYNKQGKLAQAANAYSQAALKLNGKARAQSYFHAALAQQKLGWWPQARASLMLARGYTTDPAMIQQIQDYLHTVGFTLQVGAYRQMSLAQQQAKTMTRLTEHMRIDSPWISAGRDARLHQTIYRVLVGRFSSYHSAAVVREKIARPHAMIVPLARP